MSFFRFPHTPHLFWLGEGTPRDDKVLADGEADDFLQHDLVVEEKVDGANVGISLDAELNIRLQNRGHYIDPKHCHPQFKPLFQWIASREEAIREAVFPDLILFGEWCHARHSIHYSRLPDWFLFFDVYDQAAGRFYSTLRRSELFTHLNVAQVPRLEHGRLEASELIAMAKGKASFADTPREGIYVRHDRGEWLEGRAKIVNAAFQQAIESHWSQGEQQINVIEGGRTWL